MKQISIITYIYIIAVMYNLNNKASSSSVYQYFLSIFLNTKQYNNFDINFHIIYCKEEVLFDSDHD